MSNVHYLPPTIEARIAALERHVDHMAQVNVLLAAGNLSGIKAMGYDNGQIMALQQPNSLGEIGFASRTFSETEEKIRQLRRGLTVLPVTEEPGFDGRISQ